MKSTARFSAWVALAAFLCFAPCALGEGPVHANKMIVGHVGDPGPVNIRSHNDGWGNQGGGGWGGSGNGGGEGVPVPEGGTALGYLALAGLSCFGAMVFRTRRQSGVSEASN